jgi:hypothetical protein
MCFWWGDLKSRDHVEYLGVYGRIILDWIMTQSAGSTWTGSVWLRIGEVAGFCEYDNEPSVFMKYGEFLDWLRRFSKLTLLRGVRCTIEPVSIS